MRSNSAGPVFAILTAGFGLTAPATADQLHVPAAYPTIQSCIDAAVVGPDECVVAPGIYQGLIDFHGRAVSLRSSHGPGVTILDGSGLNGSVITCINAQGVGMLIDGFTITGGTATSGGGIYLTNSPANLTISNNIITGNYAADGGGLYLKTPRVNFLNNEVSGNTATGGGGGLYLWGVDGSLSNNRIHTNTARRGGGIYVTISGPAFSNNVIAENTSLAEGGGMYLNGPMREISANVIKHNVAGREGAGIYLLGSSPLISYNVITGNRTSYSGGGLYVSGYSTTLRHNVIRGNLAHSGGGCAFTGGTHIVAENTISGNNALHVGGGISFENGSSVVERNVISGNGTDNAGGGIFVSNGQPTHKVANNTIFGNQAESGGGISLQYGTPLIVNNTISSNRALNGGGLHLSQSSAVMANNIIARNTNGVYKTTFNASPVFRNNCVGGNTSYNFSGLPNPTGTNGNISTDPWLVDPSYGNVHIQPGSSCVNKGNNADVYGQSDIDGYPRVQPPGGTVDIGADESDGTEWPGGPYVIVRVSPLGSDDHDGSTWELAKKTIQAAIDEASLAGGDVWVQAGDYEERITLHPYAFVYGGFAGFETVREDRNWGINITTLIGQKNGSVVSSIGGYRTHAIDGFVITDGEAQYNGGGFYIKNSSPRISNVMIAKNKAHVGGGIYMQRSFGSLDNVAIIANSASNGGGVNMYRSSPTITNVTIAGNNSAFGGALYIEGSAPTIRNSIIAYNSTGVRRHTGYSELPDLRYNCVFGNGSEDFNGLTNPTGTNGNISTDPMFLHNPSDGGDGWGDDAGTAKVDEGVNDDLGDLGLRRESPAFDAGDYSSSVAAKDLKGNSRVHCHNIDMGAYEFVTVSGGGGGDITCDGLFDLSDLANWDDCASDPYGSDSYELGCWSFDFDEDGDADLSDFAHFMLIANP